MKKKTYYMLDIDNYGQPSGLVHEIELTKAEYTKLKNERVYIYESYSQALMRAQD